MDLKLDLKGRGCRATLKDAIAPCGKGQQFVNRRIEYFTPLPFPKSIAGRFTNAEKNEKQ
jgi:hypothetical protein